MKRSIRKIVAAALVTFQVILTAAVGFIPASAEAGTGGRKRSYHAYKADAPITLDGKVSEGEAWDNLPWSEDVVFYDAGGQGKVNQTFYASFKSMWYKTEDSAYLYFLVNYNDTDTTDNVNKRVYFGIDETGTSTATGISSVKWTDADVRRSEDEDVSFVLSKVGEIQISNPQKQGNKEQVFRFCVQRKSGNPQVTIEAEYKFKKADNMSAGKKIGLEVQAGFAPWAYKAAWNVDKWFGSMAASEMGALYLESDSASTRKTVTVQDKNMIVASSDVTADGSFTLPTADPHSKAQLVGWKDAEGKLYKPGAAVSGITKNMTFEAVTVDFQTLAGAQVRFKDPTGLRFLSQVKKADYDALGAAATATGTLILPTDLLGTGELTLEALKDKTEGKDYLNVTNDGWLNAETAEADGAYTFSGAIVGIKKGNYNRNFSAVGYLTVTYADGTTANFYGGYTAENATSIKTVAEKALADAAANPDKYTEAEKAILESYTK